jgi:hypothetical protein
MKILAQIMTFLSLAVCLGSAVFRFFDVASHSGYTMVLGVASVVYFIAATSWAEMRR